jgi:hypothetical protein
MSLILFWELTVVDFFPLDFLLAVSWDLGYLDQNPLIDRRFDTRLKRGWSVPKMPFVRATPNLNIKNGSSEAEFSPGRESLNTTTRPTYIKLPDEPSFSNPLSPVSSFGRNRLTSFSDARNDIGDHQGPSTPPDTPPEITELMTLKDSLAVIRTQLNQIHTQIQANISAQLIQLSNDNQDTPQNHDLISYKSTNTSTPGAILSTVQVVCAVERGLEAIVGVLENAKNGNEGEGLMGRCEGDAGIVAQEMRDASVGMVRVLRVRRKDGE